MKRDFQPSGMAWAKSFRGEKNSRLGEPKGWSERDREARWGQRRKKGHAGLSENFGNQERF